MALPFTVYARPVRGGHIPQSADCLRSPVIRFILFPDTIRQPGVGNVNDPIRVRFGMTHHQEIPFFRDQFPGVPDL
jgi:hypothetical protein